MKLATKITLLFTLILIITLGSMAFLSYNQVDKILTQQLEMELQDMAFYVSQDLMVKDVLSNPDHLEGSDNAINDRIEEWRQHSMLDFIVVMDMAGIRLTHPIASNIGRPFEGGDEIRVLTTGESYISEAKGTLGVSKRAFFPVWSAGQQVGAVSVGTTLTEINRYMGDTVNKFIPFILISLFLGVMAAFALTSNIKASIMGLEPQEISLLLKEKETILDNVKEGIVTLDQNGKLIQYNKEAARILGLTDESSESVLESLSLKSLPVNAASELDQEFNLKEDVAILYKFNLLKDAKGKVLGQVINFRDRTEVKTMAEELTGFKRMAWSLRAQNHEFLNKLHTISGLIQLDETEEALKYISKTAHGNSLITEIITQRIQNVNIAALILAKYYKAEENRVHLVIDSDSFLAENAAGLPSEDLETIIGNLLENSLDEVATDGSGHINLRIKQDQQVLEIVVTNNGPLIPEDLQNRIFQANFSTKPGQRGYGLPFILEITQRHHGTVQLIQDSQVTWQVRIPV